MSVKSYKDTGTSDIAENRLTKEARHKLPNVLHKLARKKIAFLDSVHSIIDLRQAPRGYGWEILKHDRRGMHSIRINKQYRICFSFDGTDCENLEIIDYH